MINILKEKKYQWAIAIYLMLGLIYAIYYAFRNIIINGGFLPTGFVGLKIFISNLIFFPLIFVTKDLLNIHLRVEFWWYLLGIFIIVGIIIEIIYKLISFEIKFFRLHKVLKHIIIMIVFIFIITIINVPTQHNLKYDALESVNYIDVIDNLNQFNEIKGNKSITVGFSFPVQYLNSDDERILQLKQNYTYFDLLKYNFEKKWLIYDDFDYYGKDSSKYRDRYKFGDYPIDEIHKIWEERDKLKQEDRQLKSDLEDSQKEVIPFQEEIYVYVLSSNQTSSVANYYEAGDYVLGFFQHGDGLKNGLYLNYDLITNYSKSNDTYNKEFENTLIHEITHYFYLTGKLGNSDELSKVYKLNDDKIEIYNQPIEKELEERKKSGDGGYFTIEFYSPKWIETQEDLVYYETLFNTKSFDIDNDKVKQSVNFSAVYRNYGSSNYDDEIVARINALCFNLDEMNNYNSVKLMDYEICQEFNFPEEYIDLYNTFIQEFVYNYYATFIQYNKLKDIVEIDLPDENYEDSVATISINQSDDGGIVITNR